MKRSIEHRMSKEQGSVSAYAPLKEPPDWHSLPLDHEPCLVQPLLDKGKDSAARVCMFLLQLLIMLVKAWPGPSKQRKASLGMGLYTGPRMAILWHHEHYCSEPHKKALKGLDHILFMRAMRDAEPAMKIAQVKEAVAEGTELQVEPTSLDHEAFFETVLLKLVNGGALTWPPKFPDDPYAEYNGEVWKVSLSRM